MCWQMTRVIWCISIIERVFWIHIVSAAVQEIKFEPNVMCEHIDKKATFKASQVTIASLEF
jgi:hypothetical protein